jgi:LacI family transcriptional regulator
MATIKDVAKMAGVSLSTVSRIMNNTKPVSSELRQRVNKAIKETGYTPNSIARSMVLKKTQVIGIIINDISNRYYAQFVRGIENAAYKAGYNIMLCDSNFSNKSELEYLRLMRDKMVDGIIISTRLLAPHFKEFEQETNIPMVFENRPRSDFYSVAVNNEIMSYRAVEYLIQSGHEKIGCIYSPLDDISTGHDRFAGYQRALEHYGIKFNPDFTAVGNFSPQSGYEAVVSILKKAPDITALFCVSDEMAIGVYSALYDRNINIPNDISIIGFDDIDLSKYMRPELTTVHQPIERIGQKCIDLVIRLIKGDNPEKKSLYVDTELYIRNSVKTIIV